jgi:xanthosine utilization system XapX-like protein
VIDVLGDEVPAPAPGSTIRVVGLTGMMSERVVPSAKETT